MQVEQTETDTDTFGSSPNHEEDEEAVADHERFVNAGSSPVATDELVVESSDGGKRKYTYVNRKRKEENGEGLLEHRRKEAIGTILEGNIRMRTCCHRRKCFQNVDKRYLSAQAVLLASKSRKGRREYLKNLLHGDSGLFFFNGIPVCATFLEGAFRFSRYLQLSVKRTPASSQPNVSSRRNTSSQRDSVICFLERLAESTADAMPDSKELHLPYHQKTMVYDLFVEECKTLGSAPAASSCYFFQVWKSHVSHIKVRKTHRFAICSECEQLRDLLSKGGTNERANSALRLRRKQHNEMVMRERREYMKKCQKAGLHPAEYCSVIIDGADQSAFGLPHFTFKTKDTKGHSLKVKLVGLLEHGPVKHLSLYTMTEEYETGANHVIEVLHRSLSSKHETSGLPHTLFIQVATAQGRIRFDTSLLTLSALLRGVCSRRYMFRFFLLGIPIPTLTKHSVALQDGFDNIPPLLWVS